jgi:hypothetical protein
VVYDSLDVTLGLEVGDCASSKRTVDLHSVDNGRGGDDSVGGDLLHDSVAVKVSEILPSSLMLPRLTRWACRGRRRCWTYP